MLLKEIDFGEPDANAEYVIAKKKQITPIFIRAHTEPPIVGLDAFEHGTKYILHGQKGTGKTAVLRYLQSRAEKSGRLTEFVVFRNEIVEQRDLLDFTWPVLVDEEKIKNTRHYLHTVKRLLLIIILHRLTAAGKKIESEITVGSEQEKSFLSGIFERIKRIGSSDSVTLALESITNTIQSLSLDPDFASKYGVKADASRLLKRHNDVLLSAICRTIKAHGVSATIYVDEIHFAYRDEATLAQDAMLIRDTVIAIANINERFTKEELDCHLIMSFRSEFLEHPLIASAEINNIIASFGEQLSWADFPARDDHPILLLLANRVQLSTQTTFLPSDVFSYFIPSSNAKQFIFRVTWSKPRDVIRFFNSVRRMYGHKAELDVLEFNAAWRDYARSSWLEIKTAASAFMPPVSVVALERVLRDITPSSREEGVSWKKFTDAMRPVYNSIEKNVASAYGFDHFMHLLYILGIFLTQHNAKNGERIYLSYHRGARYPMEGATVLLHQTVARAFT